MCCQEIKLLHSRCPFPCDTPHSPKAIRHKAEDIRENVQGDPLYNGIFLLFCARKTINSCLNFVISCVKFVIFNANCEINMLIIRCLHGCWCPVCFISVIEEIQTILKVVVAWLLFIFCVCAEQKRRKEKQKMSNTYQALHILMKEGSGELINVHCLSFIVAISTRKILFLHFFF